MLTHSLSWPKEELGHLLAMSLALPMWLPASPQHRPQATVGNTGGVVRGVLPLCQTWGRTEPGNRPSGARGAAEGERGKGDRRARLWGQVTDVSLTHHSFLAKAKSTKGKPAYGSQKWEGWAQLHPQSQVGDLRTTRAQGRPLRRSTPAPARQPPREHGGGFLCRLLVLLHGPCPTRGSPIQALLAGHGGARQRGGLPWGPSSVLAGISPLCFIRFPRLFLGVF